MQYHISISFIVKLKGLLAAFLAKSLSGVVKALTSMLSQTFVFPKNSWAVCNVVKITSSSLLPELKIAETFKVLEAAALVSFISSPTFKLFLPAKRLPTIQEELSSSETQFPFTSHHVRILLIPVITSCPVCKSILKSNHVPDRRTGLSAPS